MVAMSGTTFPLGDPWPYPSSGYTCSACGQYVAWGTQHFCTWTQPSITTTIIQEAPVSNDFELEQITKISEALDKARTCYGNLREEDGKKRAVAYLAARFGVSEEVVIDALIEEA